MKSLILVASFIILAGPAMADTDNAASCRTLAQQTNAALSNASGNVAEEAKAESRAGMQACNFGFWQNGAAHYRRALTLLGK